MVSPSHVYGNIPRPTLSELGIDILVKAGIGFAIGSLFQVNGKLIAIVLAAQSIASMIFYEIGKVVLTPELRCKTVSELARAMSYSVAIYVLHQCGLLSLRVSGLFEVCTLAFLLARISWIQTANPPSFKPSQI